MESISPQELKASMERENPVVIDVRSRADYEKAHVPGAQHIHVEQIKESVPDLPKDRLIVTY